MAQSYEADISSGGQPHGENKSIFKTADLQKVERGEKLDPKGKEK